MNKTIYLGMRKVEWRERRFPVFCKIEWKENNLSITGVEGPLQSGNCIGGCGQIVMSMDKDCISSITFAEGWNRNIMRKFISIWNEWHLNDLQAGCEHQRKYKPLIQLLNGDSFFNASNYNKIINLPLYGRCYVCNYQYGTAWLKKEVPNDVIKFLFSLPESSKTPAWV